MLMFPLVCVFGWNFLPVNYILLVDFMCQSNQFCCLRFQKSCEHFMHGCIIVREIDNLLPFPLILSDVVVNMCF